MTNPMVVHDRQLVIPSSVEVGDSWKNLKTWKGGHSDANI